MEARRDPGPFAASVQTRNDAAAQVLGLVLAEMRRLGAEPIPAAELAARRASLTGDFGRDMETTAGTAGVMASYVMRGINPDEVGRYLPSVLAVTPAEAQGAAAALFIPDNATVIIVGEASQFIDQLRRDHPDVQVIPLTGLNLNSPALRSPSGN
jgi:zinc protease